MDRRTFVGLTAAIAASSPLSRATFAQTAPKAKNVVLVHGLFADGSSWSEIIPRLQAAGLNVISVQNPPDDAPRSRRGSAARARTTEWTDGSSRAFIFRDDRHRHRCASECLGPCLCGCARAGCWGRLHCLGQELSNAAGFGRHRIRWR